MEQQPTSRIARCTSSGFRPSAVNVTWVLSGESPMTATNTIVMNDTNPDTFRLTSYFSRSVTRHDNGKVLSCSVNHETLQSPVTGNMTLDVMCKCSFRCGYIRSCHRAKCIVCTLYIDGAACIEKCVHVELTLVYIYYIFLNFYIFFFQLHHVSPASLGITT